MKLQTANKDHKCDECGLKIEKGSKYWNEFDSEQVMKRTHCNCLEHQKPITAKEADK